MSRLEAVEIKLSKTFDNKDFRLDSSFWTIAIIKSKDLNYDKIGNILVKSQYGISISMNEEGKGYPIYRMNEITNMLCDLEVDKFADIDRIEVEVFKLKNKDVLFNRTNSFEWVGRTGIFYKNDFKDFVFASYLVRFVPDETKVKPEYLTAFLSSKYGIKAIKARSRESINQTNVNPEEVKEIEIPLLNADLQNRIVVNFEKANELRITATNLYESAQKLLLAELRLADYTPTKESISVKTFTNSFGASGRLDAEYYQPKYEEIIKQVQNFKNDTLENLVDIKKSIEPGSEYYGDDGVPFIRVSNLSKFEISEPDIKIPFYTVDNINKLFPKKDTILLSKDGSVGIAYKLMEDMDCITSGAILHLNIYNEVKILPDYLTLVLNSIIVQFQAERDAGGSIIQH